MMYPTTSFFLKKGLGLPALYKFTKKEATPRQLQLAAKRVQGNWEFHCIPPKIFSVSESVVVRQRRIFAAVLLRNYLMLKENSQAINGQNEEHPSLLSALQYLCLCYNAYVLTISIFSSFEEGAALSFNSSTRLIQSFLDDLVVLTHCPCGRPVLLRVQNIFTSTGSFRRNFFRCPWCNRMDQPLKIYMAERLQSSEQWAKYSQQIKPSSKNLKRSKKRRTAWKQIKKKYQLN